jgi:protein-disulfide isomerase
VANVTGLFSGIGRHIAAAAVLVAVSAAGASAVSAQEITDAQRSAFEGVIRDYLLKNPAVIREAMQALQQREEAEKQAAAARAVKQYQSELLNDVSSPVGGNPDGDITIVEFFDYNCGYCKRVVPAVAETLKNDPNVRLVYKEFAILGQESVFAARAALAAKRQGKYHEFHNALMTAERADGQAVVALSKQLGLDQARLLKDMQDPAITKILERNYQLANALGINGTPAFVIGDRMVPGAMDAAGLAEIIAAERAKKKAATDKPGQ